MSKTKTFSIILLLGLLASCNSKKVSCEMKEGIEMNQYNLKLKLTKMLALKYASENYKKTKKGFWDVGYTDEYKKYLKMNLDNAENEIGRYFKEAKETLADDSIVIEKIIPISYDKEVNKCECEATMKIPDTKIEDKFKYDITRDSKGELVGHYSYMPAISIDNEKYDYVVYTLRDVSYEKEDFEDKVNNTNSGSKEEKWETFWKELKTAFVDKDKETIISLSTENFFDGGGGGDAKEWVTWTFEDTERYNRVIGKIKSGVHEHTSTEGDKYKSTGKNDTGDLFFDYKNGEWLFGGVVGD